MHAHGRRGVAGITIALTVMAMSVIIALVLIPKMTTTSAYRGDSCEQYAHAISATQTLVNQTRAGSKLDVLQARIGDYIQQAKDAKCDAAVKESSQAPSPSTSSEASAQGTVTDTATVTQTVATTVTASPLPPKNSGASAAWMPHYYTLDSGKNGPRDFGPSVAIENAVAEFHTRMEADPSLLCGNGGLILSGKDGGADCVRSLLESTTARDTYMGKVFSNIASMKVETRGTGPAQTAYMVVGQDGIPRIFAVSINRTSAYHVLVVTTKDGTVYAFRLECGFQWDSLVILVKPPYSPPPSCIVGERVENGGCGVPPPAKTVTKTPSATTAPTPPSTPPGTTNSSPPVSTSLAPKTSSNPAVTQSESHSVNSNDGSTDSQGLQKSPEVDASEAAAVASSSNNSKSSEASSSAANADTDSGGGTAPHGHVSPPQD